MPDQPLRIFVSSRMEELASERTAIQAALSEMEIAAILFDKDIGARNESVRQVYIQEVEEADLYVGLFWKGYGEHTITEYDHARKLGKNCLIYEKYTELENRNPDLKTWLDQVNDVDAGQTIKRFTTTEELCLWIKKDVAQLLRDRFRRAEFNLPVIKEQAQSDLLILLRKVKQFWIEGYLSSALRNDVLLELGMEPRPDAIDHPWGRVIEVPDSKLKHLPTDMHIGQVFNKMDGHLLILGEPGSGKTITLLELASDLIESAERNLNQPIPVIFNLSSWAGSKLSLLDWMTEELLVKYQIPKKFGKMWLQDRRLLPLLDGLDEVRLNSRVACVEAINMFMMEHPPLGLVVCCRRREYDALSMRLRFNGAIYLQPLSPEQIDNYLIRAKGDLTGLEGAIKQDAALQELAQSPMILNIMAVTFQGTSIETLIKSKPNSIENRRTHLFNKYIESNFKRKGKIYIPYERDKVIKWLVWLAQGMKENSSSAFLIEQLQPSWLVSKWERYVYILLTRIIGGLLLGLVGFMNLPIINVVEINYLGANFLSWPQWQGAELFKWLVAGSIAGIVIGCFDIMWLENTRISYRIRRLSIFWQTTIRIAIVFLFVYFINSLFLDSISLALIAGIFFGIRGRGRRLEDDIKTTETLIWSWSNSKKGILSAIFYILIVYILLWMVSLTFSYFNNDNLQLDFEPEIYYAGLIVILQILFPFILIGILTGGFFGGLRSGVIEQSAVPNIGIKLSALKAAFAGGLAVLLFGLSGLIGIPMLREMARNLGTVPKWSEMMDSLIETLYNGQFQGVLLGITVGLVTFLWYGWLDVIQHFTLRLILWYKDYIPFRCVSLLNYATDLIFLRKSGGSYLFIHKLFLEHFAAMPSPIKSEQKLDDKN